MESHSVPVYDPDFDYTLKIAFEECSLKELSIILKILYNSSQSCYEDIKEMTDIIILTIKDVGYELKKHKDLCRFVKDLFNVLKKIKALEHIRELHDTFNHYYTGEPISPVVDSPESPVKVFPPKIMKKCRRRKDTPH
jgi:hypothetical protein